MNNFEEKNNNLNNVLNENSNGILIVNKPVNKTSFDMVYSIRKEYHLKKVGHIGTLDPMAEGVLPILLGKATKLSDYLMEHDKEYIATLAFGEKRDTLDSEGKVIDKKEIDYSTLNKENIINVLNSFLGKTMQIPPMYSAIKVNGKKLYELARKGETIEREPREINVYSISLLNLNDDNIVFKVNCSKGTYIRVLCEDIAKKLNNYGYMSHLKRTRVRKLYN